MSGETEAEVSGWTVDTLHSHLQMQIRYLTTMLDERQANQMRNLDTALNSLDRRLEGVNEFRQTLSDQSANLMPRTEAEARLSALDVQIRALNQIVTRNQGRSSGMDKSWAVLIASVGAITTLIVLFLTLYKG